VAHLIRQMQGRDPVLLVVIGIGTFG
jgi:hypothetical protein